MDEIERMPVDPPGCICPQDYVKPDCPIHDPDGMYYHRIGESEKDRLRRQLAGAVEALREIALADPIDMALDPGWAARIAKAALHASEGGS